jgi:predicted ATPase
VLTTLAVENYRSLRNLVLPLSRLTVVTGANGSGKSPAMNWPVCSPAC